MEGNSTLHNKICIFKGSIKLLFEASRYYTIFIFILSILRALVAPLSAIAYKQFLDSVVKIVEEGPGRLYCLNMLLMMAILRLLSFFFSGLLNYFNQVFCDKLDIYITDKVLNKASLLAMETFDKAEVYNHINRAVTQTSSSCIHLLRSLSESIYSLVKGISFIYIIQKLSWLLVVISLISLFPLLYISTRMNEYWYKIFYNRVEKKRLIDYLKKLMVKNEYVKEIKLYGTAIKISSYVKNSFLEFFREDLSARKKFLTTRVSVQSIDEGITLIVKLWVLILGLKEKSSIGTIMLYFNSLDNLKFSYSELIDQFSTLQNSLLYMESLNILTQEKECDSGGVDMFDSQFDEIEFRNVSFRYPGCKDYVLKNISLKLKRGETYFIVGFNGSGKTTLIKLLLRLYTPTEGEIFMGGKPIDEINLKDYYLHFSAVFQDFIKYPFDVYENVAIRSQGEDKKRFDTVLDFVGMREFVDTLPKKEHTLLMRDWTGGMDVSQGQWQKLAIARSIFNDSIITILDEPFSSLDAESERHIISNLRKAGPGKLTIYVTHRFSSISPSDNIIVMKDGRIEEEGTHHYLMMNKGIYYTLYSSQKMD